MDPIHLKLILTAASIFLFFVLRIIAIKAIDKTVKNKLLQKTRGKIVKKFIVLILVLIVLIFCLTLWGVDRSELFMFMASVLTVIGIALFAQWSLLSNITSGIIIFFNHSVKLDDSISILDKEYEVEGRVSDIGLFFIKLKNAEGEEISLPNNVFLQKMIKKQNKKV